MAKACDEGVSCIGSPALFGALRVQLALCLGWITDLFVIHWRCELLWRDLDERISHVVAARRGMLGEIRPYHHHDAITKT